MLSKRVYRNIQSLLLLSTILVLGIAFYFEHVQGLQPCPLCLMQRLCTFIFGFFCLMGMFLLTLKRAKHIAVIQMGVTLAGIFFVIFQLWLQSLPPDQTPVCMPAFDALVHYFSWDQVLKALLWGTGECGEVTWRWLGLSMPGWSAVYFVLMFLVSGLVFWFASRTGKGIESK